MKTLTKTNIEEMANEIIAFLEKHELASDVSIYFNGKVMRSHDEWDENDNYKAIWTITENVNPHDYFEYCAFNHILSMSFEGALYDVLNYTFGKREQQFLAIFEKYGLYYEFGHSWNLSAYPDKDDMDIEYTVYERR